ncbi:MAG: nodulation protein NfeD [bacterium]|nr:nodulation protein NfeD [bacterium]
MKKPVKFSLLFLILIFCGYTGSFAQGRVVKLITVQSAITPVSAEFIIKAIRAAEDDEAECLVIQLDTPGGLMTSTRQINKEILGAYVPVVLYVAPDGAQSGSAGVFITYAAHIAAMAPGTNIGAAHPVNLGGAGMDTSSVMEEKITNDAAAWIRSLAQMRGRNEEWAEDAVRNSVSVTSEEALELNVIDYIAKDLDELLEIIDGKEIEDNSGTKVLRTSNARIENIELGLRLKILGIIVDPNIAYILMLLGMSGIMLELYNPGSIFPGVIGGISLILAFYAMQALPVNYAGLMLIILAVILFILEIKIVSYGVLSIGGVISMTIGSLMLFDSPLPFLRVSLMVIIPAVVITTLFFLVAIGLAVKAQRKKPTTGKEGLAGEKGTAQTDLDPEGQVLIHGELWRAKSSDEIRKGDMVEVISVSKLEVLVKKI